MNKIYYENLNDAIERNKPNISKTKRTLEEAGVKVGNHPTEAGDLMAEIVSNL